MTSYLLALLPSHWLTKSSIPLDALRDQFERNHPIRYATYPTHVNGLATIAVDVFRSTFV